MRAAVFLLSVLASGCTTVGVWRGEFSPVIKECQPNATYLPGSRAALLYAAELEGQEWRFLDLPFSFIADVVLLPAAVPGVNRRKRLCNE